jgi:hypothetical protein
MTSPSRECTTGLSEKHKVWLEDINLAIGPSVGLEGEKHRPDLLVRLP